LPIIKPERRREILLDVRRKRISQEPFANERLEDFERNLKSRRPIKIFREVPKILNDGTRLIYYNNQLYRNFPKDKFEMWKKLVNAGLAVEPILGVEDKPTKRLLNFVKPKENEIIVRSKIVGENLENYLQENKISLAQKVSLAKQMITTITKLWELGYNHTDAHIGNWTINIENGFLKVYLIDFIKLELLSKKEIEEEKERVLFYIRQYIFDNTNDNIMNIFQRYLDSKIKL